MKFFMSSLTFNILSQKCSDERTFGIESLQYLYRKMSKIIGNHCVAVEQINVCHKRFLEDSLSKI